MTTEILIISLIILFAINTPIAIAIGAASLLAIVVQGDFTMMMVVQRMFGGTDSFHLMAVPLFVFTGVLMEAGGISRRVLPFLAILIIDLMVISFYPPLTMWLAGLVAR